MMLAHFLWEQTPRGGRAEGSTFWEALRAVLEDLGEASTALGAGSTTVREALERMHAAGHLARVDDGRWAFVDPLFERWVGEGRLER